MPPRPAGQRTEPEPNTSFQGFGFGDGGFQMSLGIGAFPFGIFTSTFNFGGNPRSQSMNICNLNNFNLYPTPFFNPIVIVSFPFNMDRNESLTFLSSHP